MKKASARQYFIPIHRLSADVIRAQAEYSHTDFGLQTARNIVELKLRNCRCILTNFRQARTRAGSPQAQMIEQAQQQIRKCRRQVPQACTIRQLFLLEAASARTYWRIVRIMCHQHEGWHRIHPQADDALNRLLNVGYTILARRCREALLKTHLMPQLGILHGSHAVEPLVYDMAEIFRQPVVDAVLLPIFSRKQKEVYRLPRTDARRAFQNLYQRYHQRVLYFGMCEPLDRVIAREAVRLRRALVDDAVWIPYAYPWRHGAKCRKAKKKPA